MSDSAEEDSHSADIEDVSSSCSSDSSSDSESDSEEDSSSNSETNSENEEETRPKKKTRMSARLQDIIQFFEDKTNQYSLIRPKNCGGVNLCPLVKHSKRKMIVYDIEFPFFVTTDYYYCDCHKTYIFSKLENVVNLGKNYRCTIEFYYHVAFAYTQLLNYSRLKSLILESWISKCLTAERLKIPTAEDLLENIDLIASRLYVSNAFIKKIVLHWWNFDKTGKAYFQELKEHYCEKNCDILRGDHTFKTASFLGGWDPESETMKRVSAQLYTLVNSEGYWVDYSITPNCSNKYVIELLSDFWYKYETAETKVFYTDCDTKDGASIKKAFKDLYPEREEIQIGQDRWHCIQRIERSIRGYHPDKLNCITQLRRIFNYLNPSSKRTFDESKNLFYQKLNEWQLKFSTLCYSESLTWQEKISLLQYHYTAPEQQQDAQDSNTYEVLRVIAERPVDDDKSEYLVQFKGFDMSHNEWIHQDNCDCDAAIAVFKQSTSTTRKPILQNSEAKKQIEFLKKNQGILAGIKLGQQLLGKQGTSHNESVHAYASTMSPIKTWTTLENLDMRLLILMGRYNVSLGQNAYDRFNFRLLSIMAAASLRAVDDAADFFCHRAPKQSFFQDLLNLGFEAKKSTKKTLGTKDREKLKKIVSEYDSQDKNGIKDDIYFIKHYIFENRVTTPQIENTLENLLLGSVTFL